MTTTATLERIVWPPLPPPPSEFAILSAAAPRTPGSRSILQPRDAFEEGTAAPNQSIFKRGGSSNIATSDSDSSTETLTRDDRTRRLRPPSRLKVETSSGVALPRMILDVKHRALSRLEAKHHAGVLVVKNRGIPETVILEEMPFASRWGCYLLYYGLFRNEKLLNSIGIEELSRSWSEREGRKFDLTKNARHRIENFIRAYHIDCTELRKPDLSSYATLNEFFYRRLRKDARPLDAPRNPLVISSAADCRLTVFPSVGSAQKLWIKGRDFKLEELVGSKKVARRFENGCVAIFRLAPSDYHRFHAPVDAVVGRTKHIQGKYYTVNSIIVRDKRFNPLGENKRDVTLLYHTRVDGVISPIAFVQVGALLVSSIRATVGVGAHVERGDELGYFAYGGSTIVCIFEEGEIEWDRDLLDNSTGQNEIGEPLETMVKVGERIGQWKS